MKYFSEKWRFDNERWAHDFQTHGKVFSKSFLFSLVDNTKLNAPDEGAFGYHDSVQRQRADAAALDPAARRTATRFVPDNSLFTTNALGFKTAQGFLPLANGNFGNLQASQVDRFTYADLHVYAEDDVDITRVNANYTEAGD